MSDLGLDPEQKQLLRSALLSLVSIPSRLDCNKPRISEAKFPYRGGGGTWVGGWSLAQEALPSGGTIFFLPFRNGFSLSTTFSSGLF